MRMHGYLAIDGWDWRGGMNMGIAGLSNGPVAGNASDGNIVGNGGGRPIQITQAASLPRLGIRGKAPNSSRQTALPAVVTQAAPATGPANRSNSYWQ